MKLRFIPLLILLAVSGLLFASCDKKPTADGEAKTPAANREETSDSRKIKFYRSTMNPRETSPKPAKDSMNMEMEPVYEETDVEKNQPGEFTVPIARQQQIGVTYAIVKKMPVQFSVRTVGTVTYDTQRHWDYVSRVAGYVQKLFITSPGEAVEKNSPLLAIYSPDLLTTENEFVDLLRSRDKAQAKNNAPLTASADSLVASAKERLRLWNISDAQITALEKTRKPQEDFTLVSPFHGVVQSLSAVQGAKVKSGDHLVSVTDLSEVWVWAQFYQNDIPLLKTGEHVEITTSAYPGKKFDGKISVVDPFMNNASRTVRARIDVKNPDLKLLPEMYVNVALKVHEGESLAVPVNAVLPTGEHNIVFVDKGGGRLEPRFIQLGRQFGDFYQVRSGLREGERVIDSANFLIDAESQIQGALKSW